MTATPRRNEPPKRSDADNFARFSVGLGAASVFTILLPTFPIFLGAAALMAVYNTKRARKKDGSAPGPEQHGLIMGCIGIVAGIGILIAWIYAISKIRG